MEKAMREAKEEISKEKREMEQKAANIVVYGAKESVKEDVEERRKDDAELVKEMVEAMGVEIKGDMEVRFRAGKKSEEGRPRPMIVKVEDEDFTTPWLNIGIWSENYLWANIEHNYWYAIGQVSDEDFATWIHICLNINIENYEIETSINGKSFNKTQVSI